MTEDAHRNDSTDASKSLVQRLRTVRMSCWVFFVFGLVIDKRWDADFGEMLLSLEWREAFWVASVMVPLFLVMGAMFGAGSGILIRVVYRQPPRLLNFAVEVMPWFYVGSIIHYLVLGLVNRGVDDFLLLVGHVAMFVAMGLALLLFRKVLRLGHLSDIDDSLVAVPDAPRVAGDDK